MKQEELKWIIDNDFKIHPSLAFENQIEILMKYLGSPDTNLREGALDILYTWIFNGLFSDEKLIELADRLVDNSLIGLGEENTDSVFLRAFSVLILAGIIDYDERISKEGIKDRKPFLTKEKIFTYFQKSVQYYQEEKDIRGFVKDKEWAHSIAHGADLFRNYARSRFMGMNEIKRILTSLGNKITEPFNDVYGYFEDFRIAIPVYTCFMRNILNIEEIETWLQDIADVYFKERWFISAKESRKKNGIINTRMFLYSFYMMVKFGISKTGSKAIPFYENNMLKYKDQICHKIEQIFYQIDNGIFLHNEKKH